MLNRVHIYVKRILPLAILFYSLLGFNITVGAIYYHTEPPDTRLDLGSPEGAKKSEKPKVISDGGGHVYVVWEDKRDGESDIYFNYSADNGATWQNPDIRIDLGDNPGKYKSKTPVIAITNKEGESVTNKRYVYIAWVEKRDKKKEGIYLNYSVDNGATWQNSSIEISRDKKPAKYSIPSVYALPDGHVYVLWHSTTKGESYLFINYSTDYGATWQPNAIKINRSGFTMPHESDEAYNTHGGIPIVAFPNGMIHVFWSQEVNDKEQLFSNYSMDFGLIWQDTDIRVGTGTGDSRHPALYHSPTDGHIYVVYEDNRDGDWGIYLSHSDMHGMPGTWNPDIRVDIGYGVQGSHSAKHPAIAGTNSHIYVSWLDSTAPSNDNRDIYFNVSTNHGEPGSWLANSQRLNISHPPGTFDTEPLHLRANTSGRVFVCWEEKHDNGGVEGEEIRLNYSDDYGVTWLSADIRVNNPPAGLTNSEAEHHFSYLDDSGLLSFVWEDNRNGKNDIYYNKAMGGAAVDTEAPVTTAVPTGDIYGSQLTVDLTATDNTDPIPTIYYTTDGTDPTIGGPTTISGPSPITGISISAPGLTILKFFAVDSSGNSETIKTEQYTIDTSFPTTTASPIGNRYGSAQSVTLTANEPATIYYTTDGTTPAVGGTTTTSGPSPVTGIPISAEGITQLKFFAIDLVGNNEPVNTEQYIIDTTPPTTIAEPIGTRAGDPTMGVFATPIHVRLIPDEVATTYYTIDGTNPTIQSPVMGFDIHITGDTLLKFFSVDIIGNQEAIKSENYVIDTIPPTSFASVTTGTYRNPQTVTLSVTDNYDPAPLIFYTIDGSEPTMDSILYTAPIIINTTTTLKFFSMDMVMNHETTNTEVYTIYPLTTASPAGGIYSTTQYVTLTSDPQSTIYYTTDGTTPVPGGPGTTSGMSPISNIAIASSLTLNFFAVDSYGNTEPLKSETYTIDNNPPYTIASPAGGIYTGSQSVTLSAIDDTDPAPNIYYSLDGIDPTIGAANTYSGASPVQGITISSNKVLKFFAVDNLGNTESIKREDYTILVPPSVGHSWIWAIDDGARPTPRTYADGTPIIVKSNGTGVKNPILRLRMAEYVDQDFTNETITLVYTTDPTWSSNFFIVGEPGSAPSATNKFRFRDSTWITHEGTAAFPSIFIDPMMSNLTISGIEVENYPALHSVTGDNYYEHDISLDYLGDETETYYFRGVTRGELWSFSSMHGNQGPTIFAVASGQSKYLTFPLESFDTGYIADGLSPDTGSPADSYTYKVVYTDEGGSAPVNPYVYINGVVQPPMSVDTGAANPDLSDGVFTNGEQYTLTVTGSSLNLGANTYYFDFDGIRLPTSGTLDGPYIGTNSEQHNWIWAYDNAARPTARTSYENTPITVQAGGTGITNPILRLRIMEHTLNTITDSPLTIYYSTDPTGQIGLQEVACRTCAVGADKFEFIDSNFLNHAQTLDQSYSAQFPALLLDHIGVSIAGLQIEEGGMVSGYTAGADEWREHDFAFKYVGDETAAYYFFGVSGGNVWTAVDTGEGARLDTLQSNLPIGPTNLVAAALSTAAEIDLTWTDNSNNEVGFKIERKVGAGGTYAEIATTVVDITTYNDTGLLPNTTYYYRIRGYNLTGNSNYSNEVFAMTPAVNAPGNLTATPVSTSQIDLSWSDNSTNETEFVVQRALSQGAYSDIATLPPDTTSYSDTTGLTPDTEYFYRVMARITGGGNSAWSNEANVRTLPLPPAAPTSLSVTVASESRIDLSWVDNSTNESGFRIERKIGVGGTYTEIDLIGSNFTNYNDTGLTPNTTYYYRIRATNAGGDSGYSNEASGTTVIITPPGSLSATAVSSSQVDLTWTDLSANETGYKIERKTGVAGTYSQVATVGQDITQFTDTGLIDGTSYYYRVRGYNAQADSGYSNEANVVTPLNLPDSLTASTLSNDQIYLMWNDNSSSETGYKIERKTGVAGTYSLVTTVAANVNTYTDSGLNEITEYYYRIKAVNVVTGSPYSNEANATTMLNPPTGVVATPVLGSQIDLAWTDNSSSETGYKIERKTGVAGTYAQIATTGADTTIYIDTGLTEATTYYYRIRAYDLSGDSPYSSQVSTVTLLNAPTGLAAVTISANEIDLTWTDNSASEDGFKIERKQGVNGTYAEIASLPAGTTLYNDTGLTDSTTYYYHVWAYSNTYTDSQKSNEASTTTLALPPTAPSGLSSTAVSNNQIDLAWTDNSANESGFKIERKTGVAGTYTQIALTAVDVTAFSDTGLNEDTDYYYRVRSTNQAGDSAYSNELSALTLLNPPTSLVVTALTLSDSQIDLTWADNSSSETGYKVERKIGIGGTYAEIADIAADSTGYNDTSLTEYTTYYYRVKAYNTTPNSSSYDETSEITLLKTPTGLTAVSQSASQINITWADKSSAESGYQVERKEGASGLYTTIATLSPGTTLHNDTGLIDGTRYYYRVKAINGVVDSLYSNEDSAVTTLSAPGGLLAAPISPGQINLTWTDNSSSEQGFKIERKTGAGGAYSQVATVGTDTITYNDTGLIDGTTYYYRIRATNGEGDSSYSNEASGITPLDPPTGLAATAISGSQIDITWVDNSATESGYRIERKIGSGGTYTEIGTVGANGISYSDAGLTDGLIYYYQVRAYSVAAGQSAYSNEASAMTPIGPPTGLSATVMSGSQIDISWIDNSASEDGFKIERKEGVSGTYQQLPAVILADVTSYSDTGLTDGTNYYYRIRATNSNGDSTYSDKVSAWTPLNPPVGLTAATQSESEIKIDWTDQSATETGFKIERKEGISGTYVEIATVGAGVTTYTNSGLNEFTTYYYRVRSTNSGGDSTYSNEASAVTQLNPPSSLIVQVVSSSRIDLSWTDNSLVETGFSIERKTDQVGYSVIATPGQNTTVYNDTGVIDGVRYYYRVRATDGGADSPYSNEASAITPLNPPSGLTASAVSDSQIDLLWTDNSSGGTGYTIEQKIGLSGSYSEIAQVGTGVTLYNVTGLVDGIIYYYRLKTINSLTESSYSNEALAMTPLIPPSNLTAASTSNASITLTWLDNTPSETGYKIDRKTGAGGTYQQVNTVGVNVTTYLDTGLTANTAYYYRIRAANADGDSQYSNEATATTSLFAPSNLTAATLSPSQIRLNWSDNSIDETGFRIERKTGAGGTYAEIATVGADIATYDDTGLTDSTQYYYRVRAYDANGNSSYSNEANAVTYPLPPADPGGLNTQPLSSTEIRVTWTDNSNNEDGFRIERSSDGVNYQQIATVGADSTSYNNSGLSPNTTYYYRVRAYNTGGDSGYSNTASNSTLILDLPSGLNATVISDSEIDLTWFDNSSGENGFIIERSLDGVNFAQIAAVGPNSTSYNNIGLSANTTYYYRVKAYNGTGESSYSNTASAATYILNPPSALSAATISGSQIDLAWTDNSNNEDGFRIERKTGVGGTYSQITTVPLNSTSYSDTGLTAGTTYYYRVRAYNISGNSPYSNEANAMTTPPPPVAPGGLTAAGISSTGIGLSWTDNSNNETGFRIERRTGVAPYQEIATVLANSTSYNDAGLTADTTYYYQIRAYNAGGNSGYSNEASAATLIVNAPGGLTANAAAIDRINLAWTDNSNNEDGFKVERKTGVGGTYSQIATVSANITSYNDAGLTADTTYYYQIRSYNAGGNSGYSNEASATTLIVNPPANLQANTQSDTEITINWSDQSTAETGFKIERKIGAGGTYSVINTVGQNITVYNDTGLLPDTIYYYRVAATSAGGDSPYSNEDSALTKLPPPGGLNAVTLSTNDIQLSWTDNSQEELFYIERREGSAGSFTQIASVVANTTTYLDSGLVDGKEYNYRVRGYKTANDNYSGYSNIAVSFTFLETPTNLNAAAAGSAQIDLTWTDNSVSEDGYEIIRKEGVGGIFSLIATTAPNDEAYSDTPLLEDRVYYYQVRAYNSTENSPYSNEASALTRLVTPTNLTSSVISGTEVRIDWVDNSGREDGYKIERQDGEGGTYTEIDTVGAGVTSYNDTGLSPNTTYYYRVRAYNNANSNYSQYSNGTIATTLPPPPLAPTSLNITSVSHNQIGLSWTDNSVNEDKFKIERKIGIGGTYTEIAIVGTDITSYTDNGLNELTTYYYRVRAANTGGDSGYSNEVNATTDMSLPSNLTASPISDSSISLSWTDTSSEINYYIERGIDGQNYSQIAIVGANVTTYTDTGLNEYTIYYYRVRGYDGTVYSAYSNSASAATLLKAPSGLNAVAQSDSIIQLTWTDNSGVEDGYKIERSLDGVQYTQIATGIAAATYTDTGLSDGTQYYYRVRAYKGIDNSGYSNAANETTPMIAPTGLNAVSFSSYQIDLSWTDNSSDETGFRIERKIGVGGTYSIIDSVGTDITSYSNTGLTPETTYYYRVRGYNSNLSIESFNSNEASAATFLTPPGGLTATAQSTSQIDLSWTDNTGLEDGYKIERSPDGNTWSEIATSLPVDTASYNDTTGLIDGTRYYYRVRAYKGTEDSSPSNTANAVTTLAAPTGLSASAISNSEIDLTWTDTSSSETGFKIERKTGAGSYIEIALINNPNITAYNDTGLDDGIEYYYQIRAFNSIAGDSAYSNEANAVTGLNAPTGLSAASVSNTQIDLTWTDTSSSETGFKIERKTGAGGTYAQIALTASGITSYSDTGLTDGMRYYYRLRTTNSIAGDSAYSNEANAATGLNIPTVLSAAPVSSSQIDLTWTDTSSSETGFKIERKTGAGGTYTQITLTGADITSYSDTGLTDGTLYYYRVRASNNDGDSSYSNEASGQTYSAPVLSFSSEFGYETLDGIHPNIGDISTSFTYKIIYADADGQQPGELKVYILKDGVLLNVNGYPMIKDDPGIDYQNGVQYKHTTTLPAGDVYGYYFYAGDGMDTVRYPSAGSFSGPQVAPVLAELRFSNESGYNDEADINNKGLEPDVGNTATAFVYKLEYGDTQDREPLSLRIHLDGDTIGKSLALDTYAATALKNGVYTDYEQYYYMLTLREGTDHTYYFSLFDGQYEVRLPSSGILNAPDVSPASNSAPLLNYAQESPYNSSAGVSPNTGTTATLFTFKVIYKDLDFNNLPTYVKVHIDGDVEGVNMALDNSASSILRDGNPSDGEQYYYTTNLSFGSHNFYFSASDGQNRVEMPFSGTTNGPNVTSVASANTLSLSYTPDPGYNGVDGVDPDIGDSTSYFTYKVVYTSDVNRPPATLKVNLDGDMIGAAMSPDTLAQDPTLKDGNYQNGEQYYYVTKLSQGSHTYYFNTSDGIEAIDLPGQDVRSGPDVGDIAQSSVTTYPITDSTVTTKPSDEVAVTFTEITSSGSTTAYRQTANNPPAPTGYKINDNAYYDISTTAVFIGEVEVCVNYSQDQIAGIGEGSLKLFHYSDVTSQWEDITTSLDTVHNIICGLTTSFSTHALGGKTATLVTLTSFGAEVMDNNIILRWTTASENNNEGFNIYRGTSVDGHLMRLNSSLIPSKGGLTSSSKYSFADTTAERGKTYYYRIEDIDIHGIATVQNMISVTNIMNDAAEILPVLDASNLEDHRILSDRDMVQITADIEEDRIVYYDISSDEEKETDAEEEKTIDDNILKRYLFEVERDKDSIRLGWKSSDRNEIGFNILRSDKEDDTYIRINPSIISLDTDMIDEGQIIDYTYSDSDILPGDSYYYKLEIIINNGDTIYIGPIPVRAAEIDAAKDLESHYIDDPS